jgi:hypothetical protein
MSKQHEKRNGRWPAILMTVAIWVTGSMLAAPLSAQDELEKPPPLPPPGAAGQEGDVPIPPKVQQEQVEPTVTIREEDDRRIEEYRLNGKLYMVKVTPEGGVPYYYIDRDGDGQLELDPKQAALDPVQPVYWKIKEWK